MRYLMSKMTGKNSDSFSKKSASAGGSGSFVRTLSRYPKS
jgi:hypothetical protein